MGHPKVFNADSVEMDFEEWADPWYGVGYRRAEPNADGWVYRLVILQEKKDHSSSLITQVLDESGLPIDKANVALWWPDAPSPPEPPTDVYANDHYPNFVHGLTNPNGDVGPGMGPGAYIDIDPETGYVIIDRSQDSPHAVWVRDPNIPSDICIRLGMRGGSHDHMDQKFQLVQVNGDDGDDGDNGDDGNGDEPEGNWAVEVSRKPGASVLAGRFPYAGIPLAITGPGVEFHIESGMKIDHGVGGFEVMAWHRGTYVIEFLDEHFEIEAGGGSEFVFCEFTEVEDGEPAQARLVTAWMDAPDAQALLAQLQADNYDQFVLEPQPAASPLSAAISAFKALIRRR